MRRKTQVSFLYAGKDERMTKNQETKKSKQEWLDENGIYMMFSEEAASRIAWIMTAAISVLTLPFIILAIMA